MRAGTAYICGRSIPRRWKTGRSRRATTASAAPPVPARAVAARCCRSGFLVPKLSLGRREDLRIALHETRLFLRGQNDHAVVFVRITERSEDLSAHPKIGVAHVRAFLDLRQTQRNGAKVGGDHCLDGVGE